MDNFFHIRMLMSILLSLSVAHLLKGLVKIIVHPKRDRLYWVHLLWAFYIFFTLLNFWWWEYRLKHVEEWTYVMYSFIIFYVFLFYILSSLLFPEDLSDYDGFKGYYYSRRKWFFGLLALSFLVDVGDTLLKGTAYMDSLGSEYILRIGSHCMLCLVAIKTQKEWYHAGMAIVFILYGISWFLRVYFVQ